MLVIGALLLSGLLYLGSLNATPPAATARPESRVMGDPNAPVTVEEYGDFQ
jgi:hypothetical protein